MVSPEFVPRISVGSGDKAISFSASLKAGTKTQMQSWCYDAEGKELCGAYFAYVERVEGESK